MNNLTQQFIFLHEIDKLKHILRQTLVSSELRQENDAEHSWHMAMCALILQEHCFVNIDMTKVLEMILIHDIVEIKAGDTPAFGNVNLNKFNEEFTAAKSLFGLLPDKQGTHYLNLWLEFEAQITNEARYATCCDRLQGFMQNKLTNFHTWHKYSPKLASVIDRFQPISDFLPEVYQTYIEEDILFHYQNGIIK